MLIKNIIHMYIKLNIILGALSEMDPGKTKWVNKHMKTLKYTLNKSQRKSVM